MIAPQKIKSPTVVSLNTMQNAKKCENEFFLQIIQCEILNTKHLCLRKYGYIRANHCFDQKDESFRFGKNDLN